MPSPPLAALGIFVLALLPASDAFASAGLPGAGLGARCLPQGTAASARRGCSLALRAAAEPGAGGSPGMGRRDFGRAAAAAAAALAAPGWSVAEEAAVPAAAESSAPKDPAELTVYGQDPKQLLLEGGVTVLGFGVVLAPTLLRAFGVIGSSEDEKEKYPSRSWDGSDDGSKGKPEEAKKDDPSSGKSL
mmetsp:Transcript_42475/g.104105  ORF Transcript_42475/g.104105 Transcript_42475/m.104105 type:complete len:189 (-) Transcript_42475:65-631(-)